MVLASETASPVPVLAEGAFVRQRDLLPFEKLQATTVTVIGAGAVGSFAVLQLVKMGIGRVEVYDHDTVELPNLGPQGYRPCDLGRLKVEALAEQMATFGGNVVPHPEKFLAQSVSARTSR